ncbi:fimbrial assembly protein [Cellulomonas sp. WB94]|uniref:PilN domain-containing protein n=1 Tax=Cellulomonas sp. WB94 TaxID=2173174 RepID=UPI000D56FEA5|nr:fimbrial assembly protein [Cellulomonas sp. WB94]PVU81098.1 fimbrial assembly protein [Cellulomonas sp. WB94]
MTAVMDRSKPKNAGPTLIGVSLPQVNLLPPEVRAKRGLKVLKRWLGVSLLATLVLCVLAYGVSLMSAAAAQSDLVTAQDETARLQKEQQQYAEVPLVLNALANAKAARTLGMSTEVQWKNYLDAITAVMPAGVSLETITVTGATPMTAAAAPGSVLQSASVGQIQFSGRIDTLPDTAAWIDALNAVPGFSDAWVSTTAIGETNKVVYYTVNSTVQVTDVAYAKRFAAAEGTK